MYELSDEVVSLIRELIEELTYEHDLWVLKTSSELEYQMSGGVYVGELLNALSRVLHNNRALIRTRRNAEREERIAKYLEEPERGVSTDPVFERLLEEEEAIERMLKERNK